MFKVPDWEDDVQSSKSKTKFTKKAKRPASASNTIIITKTKQKVFNVKPPKLENVASCVPHVNLLENVQNKNLKKIVMEENLLFNENKATSHTTAKPKKKKLEKKKVVAKSGSPSNNCNTKQDKKDKMIKDTKKEKSNKVLKNQEKDNDLLISTKNVKQTQNDFKAPINHKKEKLKKLLENNNRNLIKTTGSKLRERMVEKLKAAQFRYLNEKLYTSSGADAQHLFESDPTAFQTYHQGYQQQLKKWPVNPLDVIVKKILRMPKSYTIADMGCGEANLSKRVPHNVRSFDLVATAPGVEACDMARTPLAPASMDVAVYCLALMGTELAKYLAEANRILKKGGNLLIAEVESRFDNVDAFAHDVERLGFKLKRTDKTHQVFYFLEYVKTRDLSAKGKLPVLSLKPCLYKRR